MYSELFTATPSKEDDILKRIGNLEGQLASLNIDKNCEKDNSDLVVKMIDLQSSFADKTQAVIEKTTDKHDELLQKFMEIQDTHGATCSLVIEDGEDRSNDLMKQMLATHTHGTNSTTALIDKVESRIVDLIQESSKHQCDINVKLQSAIDSNNKLIHRMFEHQRLELNSVKSSFKQSMEDRDVVLAKLSTCVVQFNTGIGHLSEVAQTATTKMCQSQDCTISLQTALKNELETTSKSLSEVVIEMQHLLYQNSIALNGNCSCLFI